MSIPGLVQLPAPAANFREVVTLAYGGAKHLIVRWLASDDLLIKTTYYDSGSDFIPDPGLVWEGYGNHRDLSRALQRLHVFDDFSFVKTDLNSWTGLVPVDYHQRQMLAGHLYERGRRQLQAGRLGAATLLMEKALLHLDLQTTII